MKQEISRLMDGELFEDDAAHVLDQLRRDEKLQKDWSVYHLLGDVLRQPDYVHCDLSAKINARLQNEPIILAPRGRINVQKARVFTLSAAASLMALGVVVWMSGNIAPERTPQLAAQRTAVIPASAQMQARSSDYLLAHQEFSAGMDMSGGASYIRAISYPADAK